jgi:hypothetical protein
MFRLKRPCANCPFRKGQGAYFALNRQRLEEIRKAPAFQCHKTVDYSDDEGPAPGDKPQQCAGLLAVLRNSKRLNAIGQIADRLGYLNLEELDPQNEAYENWTQACADHAQHRRP